MNLYSLDFFLAPIDRKDAPADLDSANVANSLLGDSELTGYRAGPGKHNPLNGLIKKLKMRNDILKQ